MNWDMVKSLLMDGEKVVVVGPLCLLFAAVMSVLEYFSTLRFSLLVQASLLGLLGVCSLQIEVDVPHRIKAWTKENLNILTKGAARSLVYGLAGLWWFSARSAFEKEAPSSIWLFAVLDRGASIGLILASVACTSIAWRQHRQVGGDASVPLVGEGNGYYIST